MAKITELSQLDLNGCYSYVDYLTWRFHEVAEFIWGKVSLMSPAPSFNHQNIFSHLMKMYSSQDNASPVLFPELIIPLAEIFAR